MALTGSSSTSGDGAAQQTDTNAPGSAGGITAGNGSPGSGSGSSGGSADNNGAGNTALQLLTTGGPMLSVTPHKPSNTSLLTTGDSGSGQGNLPFSHLKQPDLVRVLPAGLTQVGPNAALNLIATPAATLTAGYANPTDKGPVMALNANTDQLLNMPAHWAVVGQQAGWVQILTPVGRGALPSVDPSKVNHNTLWVKASDVTISPAEYQILVDTNAFTLTVTGPDGAHTFHVGVGKAGVTDTPKGLCAIVGRVTIQSGEPGLLTNCQSEKMDHFDGAADAATAIHEYNELGFDPEVGGSVSNGCIRVPTSSFAKYLMTVPAGTPLVIK
jgi:lipoprotein-anchoring transpeptidase ErfK/SrfK